MVRTPLRRLRAVVLACAAAAATVVAVSAPARADYPERPVQVIIGFPAGGGADIAARAYLAALQRVSGKSFVLLNKPGAAGNLSINLAAAAKPDGHTLLIGSSSNMVGARFFFKDVQFDALRDFVPLGTFLDGSFVLITRNENPASTPAELLAALKKKGQSKFAFSNQLTLLAGEYVKARGELGAEKVAYKSAVDAYPDVISGMIDYMVADGTTASSLVRDGKVKPLAMMSAQRHPSMPGVPTMKELGFEDADFSIWWAMYAPAGTDPAIARKLEAWILAAAKDKDYGDLLLKTGNTPVSEDAASVKGRLERETARWRPLVEAAGVQPQ
ncbi:MAG TPA: tripartite tricarboxylate transporter substrate binding protein [Beijerinckiaceae bacterium]|jgi:tripartite-type tricarboxylate transporter receptor subunit TctC